MRTRILVLLLSAVLLALACSSDDDSGSDTTNADETTTTTVPVPTEPTGVIALGHSVVTGLNADPDAPDTDAGEYSWATGTEGEVDSIYARLIAAEPEHEGHVTNRAANGSTVADMVTQATRALGEVPNPTVVLLMSVDNDIRCDGTDAENVAALGEDLTEVLQTITDAAPDARIILAGSAGRPDDYVQMLLDDPSLERTGGDGLCALFDAEGAPRPDGLAALTGIIESYEAEMSRVCATFEQCGDAIAASASVGTDRGSFADDLSHPSIEGHREIAEAMWPRVAELLGIS